jgi:cystathionine beta-synthase/cysteine synthase A
MATRAIKEFGKCLQPSKIRAGNLKPVNSFIDLVGSTPVLGVSSMLGKMKSFQNRAESIPEIMVKLESTNPGWSVKARPALHMIEQAEKRGDINKDTVIIESSSGNTAIAIAMVSAMKGYHFKPVVDVKMPQGKLDLLRIFGADVQLVGDPSIPPDEQNMVELKKERRATVQRLVEELGERAYSPNQYANPDNAGAHMLSTGPELLEQVGGDLDAIIIPISTGGQIDGIGRFIKEHLPSCKLIGTEPVGSTILSNVEGDYYNAGSGLDYAPLPVQKMLKDDLIDESWIVPDAASFKASRMLTKHTGALLGPTTGMQIFAACALALERPHYKRIAMIGCDDGRAYVQDTMAARRTGEMDTMEEFEEELHAYNTVRLQREQSEDAWRRDSQQQANA